MGWWANLFSPNFYEGVTPNENGPADYSPGDPDGVEFEGEETYSRSLPFPAPSAWSGWPQEWSTPKFNTTLGVNKLVDTAWSCLDLNSSVLAAMPVYRVRKGRVLEPLEWMLNPDPTIYSSWQEFAKQLFWDYLMGEAFVYSTADGSDTYPLRFRVIPPWLVDAELVGGMRVYRIGGQDVTDKILHIRYQGNTADARGHGPLEAAGARITAAGLLQRYAHQLIETGGTPHYWIGTERPLTPTEAQDLLDQWVDSRTRHPGHPSIVSKGATLNQMQAMNAKDLSLLELSQFNESRIAIALGVPPFLVGLPSGGDSLTYSTTESLFDFHDRASIKPKAMAVMSALSGWALPRGQAVELNRDEYTRPALRERAETYKILIECGVMSPAEARTMERLYGEAPSRPSALDDQAAVSLTGGDN